MVWLVLLACGPEPTAPGATEPAPSPAPTPAPVPTPTPEPTVALPGLRVAIDGADVPDGATLDLGAARAGYVPRTLSFSLTATGGDLLLGPAESLLAGDAAFTWDTPPPASLTEGVAADVVLALDPSVEGSFAATLDLVLASHPIAGTVGPPVPIVLGGPYGRYAASYDYGTTWPVDLQEEVDDGDGHSEGLVRGCGFGADRFVCVGGDATGLYSVSVDGTTWERPFVGTRGWVADVAWGVDRFVAVGGFGNLAWSFDGLTWTETAQDYTNHLRAVAAGNGRWVAVGDDRRAVTLDGVSWDADLVPSGLPVVTRIAFGNGIFVASGLDGAVATTPDGVTWTEHTLGTDDRYGIAYGEGVFLTSGWPEGTWSSPDGANWTQTTPDAHGIAGYGNGAFYATDWRDQISRSTDGGVTWEEVKGNSVPDQAGFNDFAFGVVP